MCPPTSKISFPEEVSKSLFYPHPPCHFHISVRWFPHTPKGTWHCTRLRTAPPPLQSCHGSMSPENRPALPRWPPSAPGLHAACGYGPLDGPFWSERPGPSLWILPILFQPGCCGCACRARVPFSDIFCSPPPLTLDLLSLALYPLRCSSHLHSVAVILCTQQQLPGKCVVLPSLSAVQPPARDAARATFQAGANRASKNQWARGSQDWGSVDRVMNHFSRDLPVQAPTFWGSKMAPKQFCI